MTTDTAAFNTALDGLAADGGGDGPEAVYSGLMTAINDLTWRNVTRKAIILMGDAPAKDPEPFTGFTSKTVTDAARALDPATINPIEVGGSSTDLFQGLADDSGGTVFQADTPQQVAEQVVAAVDQAAVPLYTSLTVSSPARPNTPVGFSAAGSYYDDGDITSYAWDFDGDGVVDATTVSNKTTHSYALPYLGLASVTVNTNDGHHASVTAAVDVRDDAPLPPGAPVSLTSASPKAGWVEASWQPPGENGGGSLVGYRVELEETASEAVVYSAAFDPSTRSFTATELAPGDYRIRVHAVSDGGVGSPAESAVQVMAEAAAPGDPQPPTTPMTPVTPVTPGIAAPLFSAKLEVARANVLRADHRLSILAPITGRASGVLGVSFQGAGQRDAFSAGIDSPRRRVLINRRISAAQARLGTGIVTLSYGGDDDTQPQVVRLRAAANPAKLRASRPRIAEGRLTASGEISPLARGVVRLQLLFEVAGQVTRVVEYAAPIADGRYRFDEPLSPDVVAGIADRRGAVHSYTLFTGYFSGRMRGEMSSFQILGAR